jgi:hypothetical protein
MALSRARGGGDLGIRHLKLRKAERNLN